MIRCKVDADHASNTVTHYSCTGFLVYIKSSLVYWFSKKHTSIESSSFGSEFCTIMVCCDYLCGPWHKQRMMGIHVLGPAYISGNNQSVLVNTTVPESQIRKTNPCIAYHLVRKGVARDEWRTSYINTNDNEADFLTNLLLSIDKRNTFVRRLLHHSVRSI